MKTTIDIFDLKKHWGNRLGKMQIKNLQTKNCPDIKLKLTQLAIKFKI